MVRWVVYHSSSVGLISLVSIFDTIDVPIRLLRQLFLVLKKILSHIPIRLITLLKVSGWQKTCSFCKTEKKYLSFSWIIFLVENAKMLLQYSFVSSCVAKAKVLFEFLSVSLRGRRRTKCSNLQRKVSFTAYSPFSGENQVPGTTFFSRTRNWKMQKCIELNTSLMVVVPLAFANASEENRGLFYCAIAFSTEGHKSAGTL